jgi:hypothetical protein
MPLQHRHEYAAGLPRGLRVGEKIPTEESHLPKQARALPSRPSSRLEPVASLKRLNTLVSCVHPFPPC